MVSDRLSFTSKLLLQKVQLLIIISLILDDITLILPSEALLLKVQLEKLEFPIKLLITRAVDDSI